jgi:hypothetical protein
MRASGAFQRFCNDRFRPRAAAHVSRQAGFPWRGGSCGAHAQRRLARRACKIRLQAALRVLFSEAPRFNGHRASLAPSNTPFAIQSKFLIRKVDTAIATGPARCP